MNLAPILLFVYNRPIHTKRTIKSLKQNQLSKKSNLYIFSDGPKNEKDIVKVKEVRKIIKNTDGFKSINIKSLKKNKGLAKSIISGVSKIIKKKKKVIVLEDDLLLSKKFLKYMNEALDFYKLEKKIWSISGYTPDLKVLKDLKEEVFFYPRASSWGWATWSDRWDEVDWNLDNYEIFNNSKEVLEFGRIGYDMPVMLEMQKRDLVDSWAIRWCYNQFKRKKLTIYPYKTLVKNIGVDNSGTHGLFKKNDRRILEEVNINFTDNIQTKDEINKCYRSNQSSLLINIIKYLLIKMRIYKIIKNILSKLIK